MNGITYNANNSFGDGAQIDTTGWHCVYQGTLDSITVSNLKYNTTYIVHVCEMRGTSTYITSSSSNNPIAFTTDYFSESLIIDVPISGTNNILGDYNNDGLLDFILVGSMLSFIITMEIIHSLNNPLLIRQGRIFDQTFMNGVIITAMVS